MNRRSKISKLTEALGRSIGRARHVTGKLNVDKAISTADRIIRPISAVGAGVSAILIIAASLLIVAYIINRQFIGQVWLFVEEWVGLALVPIAYLAIAYTLRCGAHINVDIVMVKLSPLKRNIVDVLVSLMGLVVLGYMTERSISWFVYVWKSHILSTGPMRTPVWGFSLTMVLGMVMISLEMILHFFRTLMAVLRRSGQTDGYLRVSSD